MHGMHVAYQACCLLYILLDWRTRRGSPSRVADHPARRRASRPEATQSALGAREYALSDGSFHRLFDVNNVNLDATAKGAGKLTSVSIVGNVKFASLVVISGTVELRYESAGNNLRHFLLQQMPYGLTCLTTPSLRRSTISRETRSIVSLRPLMRHCIAIPTMAEATKNAAQAGILGVT